MGTSIIAPSPQPASLWQRLWGTEPKTVVQQTSTTTLTSVPGSSFDLKAALRNGGIGAAVAGALGGVSLLGKVALPLIGKVGSVAGLGRLALVGGAVGVASAALPFVADSTAGRPAVRAALIGAGIGAAAGAVLPLLPVTLGAMIGAGVGLLVHNRNSHANDFHQYPGYVAYPGWQPHGMGSGVSAPHGLVPVTPNYGMYGGTAMNPWGSPLGYGMQHAGYGMLPSQAQPVAQPVTQPVTHSATRPAVKPAAPKFRNARTFTDAAGNVRKVGSGTIVKPGRRVVAPATAQAPVAGSALGQLTNPSAYLQGMSGVLPFQGGSPLSAGPNLAALMAMMPQVMAGAPSAIASGAVPTLTAAQPTAIPTMPTA